MSGKHFYGHEAFLTNERPTQFLNNESHLRSVGRMVYVPFLILVVCYLIPIARLTEVESCGHRHSVASSRYSPPSVLPLGLPLKICNTTLPFPCQPMPSKFSRWNFTTIFYPIFFGGGGEASEKLGWSKITPVDFGLANSWGAVAWWVKLGFSCSRER